MQTQKNVFRCLFTRHRRCPSSTKCKLTGKWCTSCWHASNKIKRYYKYLVLLSSFPSCWSLRTLSFQLKVFWSFFFVSSSFKLAWPSSVLRSNCSNSVFNKLKSRLSNISNKAVFVMSNEGCIWHVKRRLYLTCQTRLFLTCQTKVFLTC